jgi:hypothetical protein
VTQAIFAITDGIHAPITGSAVELSACRKGEIAETLFIAGAMVHDWEIFTPFGHAQTADLCLVRSGVRPIMVQVKTARRNSVYPKNYQISCCRTSGAPYQPGDFDVLAAYLPDLNQFVLYSMQDLNGRAAMSYNPGADHHRNPSNWELLEQVAAIKAQESSSIGQPLSHAPLYKCSNQHEKAKNHQESGCR